ncbi:cytochrome P450 9e2-like [Harmonia axyridis]|uniref:cytochrome P450 9e2-like n=1 Tax=Harmonia axyridis TaxID=115357 RepID=UPI001E275E64|nr:cytochrome P450 9e2-like [Harmonia axyridis]
MQDYFSSFGAFNTNLVILSYIIEKELLPWIFTILVLTFFLTASLMIDQYYRFWNRRGVKQKYTFLFTDDMTMRLLKKQSFGDMLTDIYYRFSGTRYIGFYQFHKPILLVKDPHLIRNLCITNYRIFRDHTRILPFRCDPFWNKTIFALKGKKWKKARQQLMPLFNGRNMRNMYETTRSYAYDFTNSLVPIQTKVLEADFKELFSKFSTELTARVVYDIHNKSFKNVSTSFYTKLRDSNENFGARRFIRIFLSQMCPCIGKLLNVSIFSTDLSIFFSKVTHNIMRHRERFGIEKMDLISLLMNTRNREGRRDFMRFIGETDPEEVEEDMTEADEDLTEETIVAHAMTFFYAGFDVISTVLSFLFYELALNPDIQRRLLKDLDAWRSADNIDPYKSLFGIQYLSMVISETLRKWPPCYFTERCCNETWIIKKRWANERNAWLLDGDAVWIPIWAIHRDPKHWWQPEVFDPERFSPNSHKTIEPGTFIPFGVGPRTCLGDKYSLSQIKIVVSEILALFEVVPTNKTPKTIELNHRTLNLSPKDGLWLGLKKRFM